MLRKALSVIFVLIIFVLPASADVLWEPYDNQYYNNEGFQSFSYLGKTYVVPEGMTANLYKNPETGGLIKTVDAGTRLYIGPYTTIQGETWGAGYPYDDFERTGWVRLDRLQREYDHEDFKAEFGNQFVTTDDLLTREDVDDDIQTWTYPGSGILDRTVPADALGGGYNDGVMTFQYVYTDPDGGRWGYVGYYMGRCGWVWLDDPTDPEPPLRLYPQHSGTVHDTAPETDPGGIVSPIPVILSVALLVLLTAAALVLLKKRHRSKNA